MDDANQNSNPPAQGDQSQQPQETASNAAQPATPAQGGGDKEVTVGKYKIKVIRDACIGAASCVAVAAATFQLDNENKAVIQEGSSDTPDAILMAAQSCPTKAIVVVDTETGQQVWPA
jgi:ferredoxin